MNVSTYFWVPVILLVLFGAASSMDYEETLIARDHYCDMVESGHWPDFDDIYEKECRPLGYKKLPSDRQAL